MIFARQYPRILLIEKQSGTTLAKVNIASSTRRRADAFHPFDKLRDVFLGVFQAAPFG